MVDFSKHKHGDVVAVHCCDSCARKAGVTPKQPADSGVASWLCDVCGHHGIGSLTDCEIGDWLRLRPLQPNTPVAVFVPGRGALCSSTKYSMTTSRRITKALNRWGASKNLVTQEEVNRYVD